MANEDQRMAQETQTLEYERSSSSEPGAHSHVTFVPLVAFAAGCRSQRSIVSMGHKGRSYELFDRCRPARWKGSGRSRVHRFRGRGAKVGEFPPPVGRPIWAPPDRPSLTIIILFLRRGEEVNSGRSSSGHVVLLLGPSCAALLMGAASTPSVVHRGTTLHALRMQMSATQWEDREQTMTGAGRVLPAAKWQLKDKIALVGTPLPEASGNSVAEASQYLGVYTRQLKFFAQVKGNPYSNHGYYESCATPTR